MKNIMLTVIFSVFSSIGCMKAFAQTEKETQEITIRKNGDKDTKVTVEITGDKIMINGKPLAEFNEDGLTIMNRKMIIREGNKITMQFNGLEKELETIEGMPPMDKMPPMPPMMSRKTSITTYLGVGSAKNKDGVIIEDVVSESPAEKAGILKDDVIYKVDDTKIETTEDLSKYIRSKKADEKVKVYFLRNGKKKEVTATLATNKNENRIVRKFSFSNPNGSDTRVFTMPNGNDFPFDGNKDNSVFKNFNFSMRPKIGIKIQDTEDSSGVKILNVDKESAAAASGLLKDDILISIGDKKITNTDEAREALNDNKDKNEYPVKIKRNGAELNFKIKTPKKLKTANL